MEMIVTKVQNPSWMIEIILLTFCLDQGKDNSGDYNSTGKSSEDEGQYMKFRV
jgi:hypothetical protein